MLIKKVALAAPLALVACGPLGLTGGGTPVTGMQFADPNVRAAQETACAVAVSQARGVPAETVTVQRASSDPRNRSIVNATVAGVSGYCRVDVDARVLDVVF